MQGDHDNDGLLSLPHHLSYVKLPKNTSSQYTDVAQQLVYPNLGDPVRKFLLDAVQGAAPFCRAAAAVGGRPGAAAPAGGACALRRARPRHHGPQA